MWEAMSMGNIRPAIKLAIDLGLRNPSEPTARSIAMAFLVASEGMQCALEKCRLTKVSFINETKQYFAEQRQLIAAPLVWISRLLPTPQEFSLHYAAIFNSAYNGSSPAKPPWCSAEWARLLHGTRCRRARGDIAATSPMSFAGSGFANACLKRMDEMQNQMRAWHSGGNAGLYGCSGAQNQLAWSPGSSHNETRLQNGALMTFTQPRPRGSSPTPDAPGAPRAPSPCSGAPHLKPVETETFLHEESKRQRLSVDAIAKKILGAHAAAEACEGEDGAPAPEKPGPKAKAGEEKKKKKKRQASGCKMLGARRTQ